MNRKPIAIDLFCGLGGWTEGLLSEGWDVIGYDIEEHVYGDDKYPATLVIQDVLTIHGSQFKDADLIVASPPCQEYSYMAMPWSLAKAKAARIRADETGAELERLNRLFNACFRIQREASEAAGRHIPMVIENVRGAQPWVGRARGAYGSFFLWGDVPALMPNAIGAQKENPDGTCHGTGSWFAIADSKNRGSSGLKNPGFRFDGSGKSFQTESVERHTLDGRKNGGGSWFNIGGPGQRVTNQNPVSAIVAEGIKNKDSDGYEREHPKAFGWKKPRTSSKGKARKAASAKIAKIPLAISSYIGQVYLPGGQYTPAK